MVRPPLRFPGILDDHNTQVARVFSAQRSHGIVELIGTVQRSIDDPMGREIADEVDSRKRSFRVLSEVLLQSKLPGRVLGGHVSDSS